MEGLVVKLDRGRKRCCVEFRFDDTQWRVWVGYELVEREQTQAQPEMNEG